MNHEIQTIIEPGNRLGGFGFKELYEYRTLVYSFFLRDIKAIRNQTKSAWFWRVLQPTFTIITYTIIFERIGKVDFNQTVPYYFMMASAMLPWSLFVATVTGCISAVSSNASIYSKVYFPRLILPITSIANPVFDFILSSILLMSLLLYMGMPIRILNLLFIPLYAGWVLVLGLGVGLWLSALNVVYKDIGQGIGYVLQLAFYVSPIIYPLSAVPAKYQDLYMLNPIVSIVEGFRWSFYQQGQPPSMFQLLSFFVTAMLFFSGMRFFRKMEKSFADII